MILYQIKNLSHTLDVYQERIVFTARWWLKLIPFVNKQRMLSYDQVEVIELKSTQLNNYSQFVFCLKNQHVIYFSVGRKNKTTERILLYLNRQIALYKTSSFIAPVSLLTNVNDLLEKKKKSAPTKKRADQKSVA